MGWEEQRRLPLDRFFEAVSAIDRMREDMNKRG